MKTPFPNLGEITGFIARAMDTRSMVRKKAFSDYADKGSDQERSLRLIINDAIYAPVEKFSGIPARAVLEKHFEEFLKDYLDLVQSVSLEGMDREVSLPILSDYFFSYYFLSFSSEYCQLLGLSDEYLLGLLEQDEIAINTAFQWFEKNIDGWDEVHFGSKEDEDHLRDWRGEGKNYHLPKRSSIVQLIDRSNIDDDKAEQIRAILLFARTVDFIRRIPLEESFLSQCRSWFAEFRSAPERLKSKHSELLVFLAAKNEKHQSERMPEQFGKLYKVALFLLSRKGKTAEDWENLSRCMEIFLDYVEINPRFYYQTQGARFALNGNVKEALLYYKKLFSFCLYRSGTMQMESIECALSVAAMANDRPFLKTLKHQLIVFGVRLPPPDVDPLDLKVNNRGSKSQDNVVEDWEIERWKTLFFEIFPEDSMFPGAMQRLERPRQGLYLINDELIDQYRPDTRNLDRVITFEDLRGQRKRYPQLVFFVRHNKTGYARELLDRGANVNNLSQSGEAAMHFALEGVDVHANPLRQHSRELFDLLSEREHKVETMDQRTTKKKLLPLIQAVGSGQPEIVKKVLDMGATVDRFGTELEQTALYFCVHLAAVIRYPEQACARFLGRKENPTDAMLESKLRFDPWLAGIHIEETRQKSSMSPQHQALYEEGMYLYFMTLADKLSLHAMMEIAQILLEHGADPNLEHNGHLVPLKGYTPMMLAAERDEGEILAMMLKYGGNPKKNYINPKDQTDYDCWKIALAWGSSKTISVLKKHEAGQDEK